MQILQSLYQAQVDQQESAFPFLGFNDQRTAEVGKMAQQIKQQSLRDITNKTSAPCHMPPPKIFRYYDWTNLKHMTQEFRPATFKQTFSGGSRSMRRLYSFDTVLFPTVKQLRQDKQDSNLFVKFREVKRVMIMMGFVLDTDIESAASKETDKLMQDLRTPVPPTTKLFPFFGLDGTSCLAACHSFELQLDAATNLPPIHVGQGIDIVQGKSGDGTKNYTPLNAQMCLQQTSTKQGHNVTNIAKTMSQIKEGFLHRERKWSDGFRANTQDGDHRILMQALSGTFPRSRWEEGGHLNPELWNKLHHHKEGEAWLPPNDMEKVLIAFKELCQTIWDVHQPAQPRPNLTYDWTNFCQLLSSLQTDSSLRKNESLPLRGGSKVWTCEHCRQAKIMIQAITRQHAQDQAQYRTNLSNLGIAKHVCTLQLTQTINQLKTVIQTRLRTDMAALSNRNNLDFLNSELAKVKVDRRNAIREMAILISDVVHHNDTMKDPASRVGTQSETFQLIRRYLHAKESTGTGPQTYEKLIDDVHDRLNQGWESGLSVPLDSRLLVLDPQTKQENKRLEEQPGHLLTEVKRDLKSWYCSTYTALLQQFPTIHDGSVVSLVEFYLHTRTAIDYARKAGVPENEWKRQVLTKLQGSIIKATHLLERWFGYRKRLLQATDRQGHHTHSKDGFTLPDELQTMASFLEEDIIQHIRSSAWDPSQSALPASMVLINNVPASSLPPNVGIQLQNVGGQPIQPVPMAQLGQQGMGP